MLILEYTKTLLFINNNNTTTGRENIQQIKLPPNKNEILY